MEKFQEENKKKISFQLNKILIKIKVLEICKELLMIKNLRTILTIKNNFYKKQEKEGKQLSIKEKNKEQQMMMTILKITLMKTKYFQILEVIINIKMLMI